MRGTWLVLAAGAGAGVWLAAEHGWLAWLILSASATHAIGVIAYCLFVRQLTGRHCRCTTVAPTVTALSDSAGGGHRRIVRGQLTVGQGSAVGPGKGLEYTGTGGKKLDALPHSLTARQRTPFC